MNGDITSVIGVNIAEIRGSGNNPPPNKQFATQQQTDADAIESQLAVDKVAANSEAKVQDFEQQQLDKEQLQEMAAALEAFMEQNQRALSFHVDDSTGSDVVVVKDIAADEIIRQIPSEEMLKLAMKMTDLNGLLFNTEV
ncbi:flagellar protein FlaG [Ferrimonas lipolytica]|uniref:Flagellar protein FlaG n=1 Tax=Ferrimonas lipolytica TaxID=2724191 RepID=A0A6H1UGB4_9GAMM|nr:flagellar protein FlaG [Ferrimonas lipolytica]QIZ77363.1 flagellar protein FlaG [Ferrimonas lipolytica]